MSLSLSPDKDGNDSDALTGARASESNDRSIAFVWENFGPGHADRCDSVAKRFAGRRTIIGIELVAQSAVYEWDSDVRETFAKITLFKNTKLSNIGIVRRAFSTLRACIKSGASDIFLCHYEHPATFVTAVILRCLGRRAFVMNDSKFDDYTRYLWREVGKSMLYLPYVGAVSSGIRSQDYIRFLGIPREKIRGNYNSLSVERIRRLSGTVPAPGGEAFQNRYFSIIARFVEKKNLFVALEAYKIYSSSNPAPRMLHLYGSGKLESALRAKVLELHIEKLVVFRGFLQTEDICKELGSALALILPSVEEQFGNVVIEALAMGVPVILSENCGARDHLIRTGVNGFIVEPSNAEGFAFFMQLLSENSTLWCHMASMSSRYVAYGDVENFAEAIEQLVRTKG